MIQSPFAGWLPVQKLRSSADLESAVSPICNRPAVDNAQVFRIARGHAECNPAIQQITNLRYQANADRRTVLAEHCAVECLRAAGDAAHTADVREVTISSAALPRLANLSRISDYCVHGTVRRAERVPVQVYLEGEQRSSVRHEYVAGAVDTTAGAQNRVAVSLFRRTNGWQPEIVARAEDALPLPSIKFSLPLSAVYEGVKV